MSSKTNKPALGRGLSILLSPQENEVLQQSVQEGFVPVNQIEVNPFQPRDQFEPEALEELKLSIAQLGIIQPLTLRRLEQGRYQLISGERRLRAARMLGMEQVPAYVVEADRQGMIEMALVENLQRKDLNPIEIGLALVRLQEEHQLNQDAVAQRVGMARATVSNYTRLVRLAPEIQWALRNRKLEMGHAKVLLGIGAVEVQLHLLQQCLKDSWSVRRLEEAVAQANLPRTKRRNTSASPTSGGVAYQAVETRLCRHFESPVKVQVQPTGKGEIRIPFGDTEDLNRLLDLLFDANS